MSDSLPLCHFIDLTLNYIDSDTKITSKLVPIHHVGSSDQCSSVQTTQQPIREVGLCGRNTDGLHNFELLFQLGKFTINHFTFVLFRCDPVKLDGEVLLVTDPPNAYPTTRQKIPI